MTTSMEATQLRPVMIGVDGSDENLGAIRWAVDEAKATGTWVDVVLVIDHRVPPRMENLPDHWDVQAEADKLLEVVRGITEGIHRDVRVETRTATGHPVHELIEAGEQADVLVLGRRGRGTFKRLLLGSVSGATASRGRTTTVVVPGDWEPEKHRDQPIVLGIDPDNANDDVIRFACARAEVRQVPVHAVHVADVSERFAWDAAGKAVTESEWRAHATQVLDIALNPHRQAFPTVDIVEVPHEGHPVEVLVEAAAEAQILVVGGKPQRRLHGALLGSVAYGVLNHATCPVAVVHQHG